MDPLGAAFVSLIPLTAGDALPPARSVATDQLLGFTAPPLPLS
jgi:hypothetical protein